MYFEADPFGNSIFIIVGLIIFVAVKGISEWSSNNNSPRFTVSTLVATKRTSTTNSHHSEGHATSTAHYYVTFQFESGDRTEFSLSGSQYGMLAEEDIGILSFQGTRYLGFERADNEYGSKCFFHDEKGHRYFISNGLFLMVNQFCCNRFARNL